MLFSAQINSFITFLYVTNYLSPLYVVFIVSSLVQKQLCNSTVLHYKIWMKGGIYTCQLLRCQLFVLITTQELSINGLVQERRNSSAVAVELDLSCTNLG